jgi:hypothetical protein
MKLSQLIVALVVALADALKAQRTDVEQINKIKADAQKQIDDLKAQLEAEEVEDAEIESLRGQIEDVLNLAAAAKPPEDKNIELVKDTTVSLNEPSATAEDVGDTGDDSEQQKESGAAPLPSSLNVQE